MSLLDRSPSFPSLKASLGAAQRWLCNLTLDGEDIIERAVVAFGPEVCVGLGVDQLHVDADSICVSLHAALEQVGYAKLLCNFAHVSGITAFVEHHARAADHLQIRDLRQVGQDFILHAVGEVSVLFVVA